MLSANEAYAYGLDTYNRYEAARAEGKSETEAAGEIAGTIGGAAACSAAGAAALAPVCGALGGTLGKAIGGLFGAGSKPAPDYRPFWCERVDLGLDDLAQDAAANGISISRGQLQAWFADAANRASLSRPKAWQGVQLVGEFGAPGFGVRIFYPMCASGSACWSEPMPLNAQGMPSQLTPGSKQFESYRAWLPWSPVPTGHCLWNKASSNPEYARQAGIGLSAVAARIADALAVKLREGASVVDVKSGAVLDARTGKTLSAMPINAAIGPKALAKIRGRSTLPSQGSVWTWMLGGAAVAGGGWWLWRRKRRKG